MQQSQNYFPQMNNGYGYGQRVPIQQPYQQRVDYPQNYQQMPMQMSNSSQQMRPTQAGLNGRIVQNAEMITVNDIPMDCTAAVFPKQDMSEIYVKYWDNTGLIRTIVFKPVLENSPNNLSETGEKMFLSLSEDFKTAFMERFDSLENRLNELMIKPMNKTPASKAKKDGETE